MVRTVPHFLLGSDCLSEWVGLEQRLLEVCYLEAGEEKVSVPGWLVFLET